MNMTEELPRPLPDPLPCSSLSDAQMLKTVDENVSPVVQTSNSIIMEDQQPSEHQLKPEIPQFYPTKLAPFLSDASLDITPEKLSKPLKSNSSISTSKAAAKNSKCVHVRFDVPETDPDTDNGDGSNLPLPGVPVRDKSEEEWKNDRISQVPFKKRAALYVQRNPLADITSDFSSHETSENTVINSTTEQSTDSNDSHFHEVLAFDRNGRTTRTNINSLLREPEVTQSLPQVKLKTTNASTTTTLKPTNKSGVKGRIIVVKPELKPVKSVINQVTRPKPSPDGEREPIKRQFLKKKSALHKHEHTVRYVPSKPEEENPMMVSSYNTTLALGQELQELKINGCNAKEMVKCKLQENERLRTYIAEKTAKATNIDPKENLFQNLVSIDVSSNNLIPKTSKWKKLKPKPSHLKSSDVPEPYIWDFYNPEELYFAQPEYGNESFPQKSKNDRGLLIKPTLPKTELAPIDAAEWLDCHEQLWKGAWGWHLPPHGIDAFAESS